MRVPETSVLSANSSNPTIVLTLICILPLEMSVTQHVCCVQTVAMTCVSERPNVDMSIIFRTDDHH